MNLDELKAELDKLSPIKIAFVAQVVESLSHPPRSDIQAPGTWITGSPDWMEYFGLALSVHHAATTEPLQLTAFETVFRNACAAAGMVYRRAPISDPTVPGHGGRSRRQSAAPAVSEIHRCEKAGEDDRAHLEADRGRMGARCENADRSSHGHAGTVPSLP